ncbi:MAG: ScpA family protein [Planctomycetaceae bacterium]
MTSNTADVSQFRVQSEGYCGPLDLLVYLVRKHEIDVVDLQIASVVHEFIAFMDVLEILDVDGIAEFVLTASTLIEIKSRLVLPQPDEPEPLDEREDSQSGLIHQLLAYKKHKDAATALERRAAEWQERYPRLTDDRPQQTKDPRRDHIKEVELWDLVSAFSRVIQRNVVSEHSLIRYDDTPLKVHLNRIRQQVDKLGRVQFSQLFDGERVRSRIVGLFLAVLELLRHYPYRAEQQVAHGDIWIMPGDAIETSSGNRPGDSGPGLSLPATDFDPLKNL